MTNKDWVKIYSTPNPHKAEILKATLRENDIDCIELNKRDSASGLFGEVELYAPRDQAMVAIHLIKKQNP